MTVEPVESIPVPEVIEPPDPAEAPVITHLTDASRAAEATARALRHALAGADPVASLVLLPLIRYAFELEAAVAALRTAVAERR